MNMKLVGGIEECFSFIEEGFLFLLRECVFSEFGEVAHFEEEGKVL